MDDGDDDGDDGDDKGGGDDVGNDVGNELMKREPLDTFFGSRAGLSHWITGWVILSPEGVEMILKQAQKTLDEDA